MASSSATPASSRAPWLPSAEPRATSAHAQAVLVAQAAEQVDGLLRPGQRPAGVARVGRQVGGDHQAPGPQPIGAGQLGVRQQALQIGDGFALTPSACPSTATARRPGRTRHARLVSPRSTTARPGGWALRPPAGRCQPSSSGPSDAAPASSPGGGSSRRGHASGGRQLPGVGQSGQGEDAAASRGAGTAMVDAGPGSRASSEWSTRVVTWPSTSSWATVVVGDSSS